MKSSIRSAKYDVVHLTERMGLALFMLYGDIYALFLVLHLVCKPTYYG